MAEHQKKAKKVEQEPKRGVFLQVSPEEQLVTLREAAKALASAKTKADVVKVWRDAYLIVGHRKLGRLLLGKSPEDAMTRWGASKKE